MLTVHPHYVTDTAGEKVAVVLSMDEFRRILDELEGVEDVKLYDEAKAADESFVPIDDAFRLIELARTA